MARSEQKTPLPDENATRGYAGDVAPELAWQVLQNESDAVLVDVRTNAEWSFVGVADLSPLGKQPLTVEWQSLPKMARNADFDADVKAALVAQQAGADSAIVFICRSGARSREAAISMTRHGFRRCYNLAGGFEGDLDADHHRGGKNGWKHAGLPWRQG